MYRYIRLRIDILCYVLIYLIQFPFVLLGIAHTCGSSLIKRLRQVSQNLNLSQLLTLTSNIIDSHSYTVRIVCSSSCIIFLRDGSTSPKKNKHINNNLTKGKQIMSNSKQRNREILNAYEDGHQYLYHIQLQEQHAEEESIISNNYTLQRLSTPQYTPKPLQPWQETKVQDLVNKWEDECLHQAHTVQEARDNLEALFLEAEKLDEKGIFPEGERIGRNIVRRRAKYRIHKDLKSHFESEFFSADNPVIEPLDTLCDQKPRVYEPEVHERGDRITPAQAASFDRKLQNAKDREISQQTKNLIIRIKKNPITPGSLFYILKDKENQTNYTKDEISLVWATFKGWRYYHNPELRQKDEDKRNSYKNRPRQPLTRDQRKSYLRSLYSKAS